MKRVVVTGIGPMTSIGIGAKDMWDSIISGRTNVTRHEYRIGDEVWGDFLLHKMSGFDLSKVRIPADNLRFIKELRTVTKEDIDLYYLLAVIGLAIEDSGLTYDAAHNEIGLILTHENPGVETFFEELIEWAYGIFENKRSGNMSKLEMAKALYECGCDSRGYNLQSFSYLFSAAKVFDLHGHSLFVNNACASGLFVIEAAARQIRDGISPAVIVAGADNPTKIFKYLWFKKHGLYAEDGVTKPFSSDQSGVVFGDGGAGLVLEEREHAIRRNAVIYGEYLGGGFSLEGWKITVPNMTDGFYAGSLAKALAASSVDPGKVDLVNPHGVGMKMTDSYEAKAINRVFGKIKPDVSAFKPLVGHNLGGSAILETAIMLMGIKNGMTPGTLNCENENTELGLNIIKKNIKKNINIAVKMSCGFAGFSGVCVFGKAS